MCGLVGLVITGQTGGFAKEADIFEQLLYIDALRGDDGTGVALFCNDGDVEVLKEATTADYFRSAKEFRTLRQMFISRGKALMGHNRKMTIGKVSDETTHPFVIDDSVVFMHNGTLRDHKKLADTEVDSQALGIHLAKCKGDPRKIEEALGDVFGAYACAWVDQEKEMLYLLRNKERPLYLAKFNGGWIYASEPGFIVAVCSRNQQKIENIEEVTEHCLHMINLKENTWELKKEALVVPKKSSATPSLTTVSVGGRTQGKKSGKDTADNTLIEEVKGVASKNSYKRFRQFAVGKRVKFWITDYLDLVAGSGSRDVKTTCRVWGSTDAIEPEHTIIGKFDDTTVNEIEGFWSEVELIGTVRSVAWNAGNKSFDIYVEDIDMTGYEQEVKEANAESTTTVH